RTRLRAAGRGTQRVGPERAGEGHDGPFVDGEALRAVGARATDAERDREGADRVQVLGEARRERGERSGGGKVADDPGVASRVGALADTGEVTGPAAEGWE